MYLLIVLIAVYLVVGVVGRAFWVDEEDSDFYFSEAKHLVHAFLFEFSHLVSELSLEAVSFEFLAQEARVGCCVDIALFVSNGFDARLLELILS